jgi:hypothetical protein
MRRSFSVLFVFLLFLATPAFAEEKDDKNVDLMYPLTLRRPVFETLLDLTVTHEKLWHERETELAAELELHLLPWWQVSLEIPAVITDPGKGPTLGGLGDIGIENSFQLFKSLDHRTQMIGGFAVKLPSGSKSRGLGGETAIEPFLAGGIILGNYHLLADAAYEWTLNAPGTGERKQQVSAGLAVGYELTDRFLPLLEFKTVKMVRGENEDGPKLRRKGQAYLTPGFNFELFEETNLRFGVQLPVTHAREFDFSIHLGVSIEL